MIINAANPLVYENISIIINEFEKAAISSGTRDGAMIVAQSPLTAMDNLLAASDASLGKVQDSRDVTTDSPTKNPLQAAFDAGRNSTNNLGGGDAYSLEFDKDLAELFGSEDNPVANYLEECLNCNLRLTFDWQLKPLNLLGGIEALIDGIQDILDAFELQLDPLKSLEGICDMLNMLKGLCLPDIIIVLLSLKMLLKKYISEAIDITVDWTVILGPILKAIIQGIAALLEQIAGIIIAPLDCALNALYTANELEREARELAGQVGAFASETANQAANLSKGRLPSDIQVDGLAEDYTWSGSTVGETQFPDAPQFGGFGAIQRETSPGQASFSLNAGSDLSLPTGFRVTRSTRLDDALKDINFANSTITAKLIVPVQEAKQYIEDLLGNILKALNSVQVLVSGGISVQMGNIGIIMFLSDMISLVMMIINMMRQYPNVSDWCKQLEENPHILEEAIRNRFGRTASDIKVDNGEDNTLLLRKGPDTLMEIRTCASQRTGPETQLLDQWIQDLKRKGTS